jgi:hypothetical protein
MEKTPSKPRQINVVLNTSTNPNNESARMDNSRSNSNLLVQRLTDYEVGDVGNSMKSRGSEELPPD